MMKVLRLLLTGACLTVWFSASAVSGFSAMGYYDVADGFASLDAMGQDGTTGGAAGQVVTVTNVADFATYANSLDPYIIRVDGTLNIPTGSIDVKSNKTIVGVGETAQVAGGGLYLRGGTKNVIIRNLHFHDATPNDGITVDTSHHVWIDHCKFSNNEDGCIDSRHDTTYLTVSWSIFENHNKTFGIGWTPNLTAQMTLHHNHFDNVVQRNPSTDNVLRAHLYNFYLEDVESYGIWSRGSTNMILENSLFEHVNQPHVVEDGTLVATGCIYRDTWDGGWPWGPSERGPAFFDPSDFYDYTLDNAADLPGILSQYAGPQQAFEEPPGPPPSPGPHHWKLDETSGTTAADSVGSMNGTLTGFPSPVPWQNPGLQFAGSGAADGDGDYINDPDNMEGALTHDGFTLTLWFTPDSVTPSAAYVLFAQREDPDNQDPNRSALEIRSDSTIAWGGPEDDGSGGQQEGYITGSTTLTAGHEYFVAVTYDHNSSTTEDDLFVYLGDATAGDTSLTEEAFMNALYSSGFDSLDDTIGAFPDGNFGFDGVIVDVRTYGVALSMGELEALSGIPEPATLALLGLGGLGLLARRRRK